MTHNSETVWLRLLSTAVTCGQITLLVRIPSWRPCMEELSGGGCRAHCSYTLLLPTRSQGENEPCNAVLINELPYRAQQSTYVMGTC